MFSKYKQGQRVSLKFTHPTGFRLGGAIVIFILLIVLSEIVSRSSLVQKYVPFQAYGSNHIQFEIQLNKFNTLIEQKGNPDCLVLGTSQSLRSIDPQVFDQVYQDQTGKPILCYNFSVVGATVATTYRLGEFLVKQIHPKLLIIGTSFLDYTERRDQRNDPRFDDNPWIAYKLGLFSFKGWLLEHSYAYRLLTLVSYTAPDGLDSTNLSKEIRKWKGQLSAFGYGFTDKGVDPIEAMSPGYLKDYLESFGNFAVPTRDLDSLVNLIEYTQSEKGEVILLEMPYHSMLLNLQDDLHNPLPVNEQINQFVNQINASLNTIANDHHAIFWTTGHPEYIPENGWLDWYHLNGTSSPLFSQWLAQRVIEAVHSGQLADPSK